MRVFLSSTFEDLVEHRRRAKEAVERLDQQAAQMEVFGARPQEPQQACFQEIEASDVFVGIYAYRYGFIPLDSAISITESELRHAKELKKPIFCFLVDGQHPWPPTMIEGEPGKSKLDALKAEIRRDLVMDMFGNADDLGFKIATSLGRHIATMGPVVSGLRDLLQQNSRAPEQQRRAIVEALECVVNIARRTIAYIAQRRRSGHANYPEEAELSKGWQEAGSKLLLLPHPAPDLALRYFLKSQYWADPDSWTEDRIEQAQIGLDEISNESQALLFTMLRPSAPPET